MNNVINDEYHSKHDAPEKIEYYRSCPGPMVKAVEGMLYNHEVPREILMFDDFGG